MRPTAGNHMLQACTWQESCACTSSGASSSSDPSCRVPPLCCLWRAGNLCRGARRGSSSASAAPVLSGAAACCNRAARRCFLTGPGLPAGAPAPSFASSKDATRRCSRFRFLRSCCGWSSPAALPCSLAAPICLPAGGCSPLRSGQGNLRSLFTAGMALSWTSPTDLASFLAPALAFEISWGMWRHQLLHLLL